VIPTKERLAQVLYTAGLHDLERAARAGQYDDYESKSLTPIHDLVADLLRARRKDLAQRAASGEWDGTDAEARRWMTENSLIGGEYRKRPVVVTAFYFGEGDGPTLVRWIGEPAALLREGGKEIEIATLEGTMVAAEGDYIIRGVKGEFYPCKSDIFQATYEGVGEER